MRLFRLRTLIVLLLLSFATGLLLSAMDLNPSELIHLVWAEASALAAELTEAASGVIRSPRDILLFTLTGAVVVVPAWLLLLMLRWLIGRR